MSTPPTLSRTLWERLDADLITGVANGALVETIPNGAEASGRGATQTASLRQGTYAAASANFNGHATVTLDGSDDHYDQTVTRSTTGVARTVVLIARIASTANGQNFIDGTSSTTDNQFYYSSSAAATTSAFAGGGRIDFGARLTTPQVLFAYFTAGTPTQFARQNDGTKVTIAVDSSTETFDKLRIGAANDLTAFTNMEFQSLLVYSGMLTDADMNTLYSWAQTTYGIGGGAPPPNVPPVANAGPDQSVEAGSTVLLDFSLSSDEDGTITTYTPTLTAKPATSTAALTGTGATRTFVADLAGTYTVSLTVTDDDGAVSAADTMTVTATAPAPTLPRYVWGRDGVRRLVTTRRYHKP